MTRGPPKHYRQSTKSQRLTHLSRSTGQSRRLGGRRLVERASAISKRGSSSETSVETCVWLTPPSSLAEDCVSREIPLHRSRRRKVRFTGSTQGGDSPSVTNLFSGPDSRPFEKSPPPTVAPGDTRIKGSQDGEWAPGTDPTQGSTSGDTARRWQEDDAWFRNYHEAHPVPIPKESPFHDVLTETEPKSEQVYHHNAKGTSPVSLHSAGQSRHVSSKHEQEDEESRFESLRAKGLRRARLMEEGPGPRRPPYHSSNLCTPLSNDVLESMMDTPKSSFHWRSGFPPADSSFRHQYQSRGPVSSQDRADRSASAQTRQRSRFSILDRLTKLTRLSNIARRYSEAAHNPSSNWCDDRSYYDAPFIPRSSSRRYRYSGPVSYPSTYSPPWYWEGAVPSPNFCPPTSHVYGIPPPSRTCPSFCAPSHLQFLPPLTTFPPHSYLYGS